MSPGAAPVNAPGHHQTVIIAVSNGCATALVTMASPRRLAYHGPMLRAAPADPLDAAQVHGVLSHAVPTTADPPFWLAWHLSPLPTLVILAAGLTYLLSWRALRRKGRARLGIALPIAYGLGLGALALALLGPLDTFNDESFSLHMLQHLALVQVAAPLLVLGRPWQVLLRALPSRMVGRVTHALLGPRIGRGLWRVVAHPLTAFLAFNLPMALWHLPGSYVAALRDGRLHDLEHLSFFLGALLLWWQVLPPAPHRPPSSAGARAALLFGSAMVGDVVAAGLTLSTRLLYAPYAGLAGLGGRDALADQQLGGKVMWLGGLMFYALLLRVLLGAFRADLEPPAPRGPAAAPQPPPPAGPGEGA